MSPFAILSLIVVYFGLLFIISYFVSRKDSGNEAFFKANKNSKWYLVAFGMIGTALSGVTFISVPGEVGNPDLQFKYFQFVLGNAIGFLIIAKVLLPLYYRMNLTSIYGYIEQRLGPSEVEKAMPSYLAFLSDYGNVFRTFKHGALHGSMIGLFVALPVIATNCLFEQKSFKYAAITSGYWIIVMTIMGAIICGWK